MAKKLGFRIFMDLIPLQPELVQGTHGAMPKEKLDWPVIFGHSITPHGPSMHPTKVRDCILDALDFRRE